MSEDEVKLLTIRNLQRNDTGAYICRVLNEYGYTDLIHYLTVLPGKSRIKINLKEIHFTSLQRFGTILIGEKHLSNEEISLHIESITR